MINNKGDLGAVFKDLTSSDSLKSLAVSILTAGLTEGLGSHLGLLSEAGDKIAGFNFTRLKYNLLGGVIDVVAETAILGKPLEEAALSALKTVAASTITAELSEEIGLVYQEAAEDGKDGFEYALHKIAHGAVGCLGGAITNSDAGAGCAAGATGAVVGEIVAEFANDMKAALTDKSDPDKAFEEVYRWGEKYSVDMATIAGGLAAFVTNQDVNTAATAAGNAARNNALPFIAAAMAIATAYDLWSTYTEAKAIYAQEGEAGVAKYLATQGVMNIVAGKFMKAFKAGKALSKTEFVKSIGSVLKKRFKKLLKRGKKKDKSPNKDSKLLQDKIDDVLSTPKGQRPDPSTYLSKADIDAHLAQFDGGAIRFSLVDDVVKYGTAGPLKGGFVMPKSEFDNLVRETRGNLTEVERKLGLNSGSLSSGNTMALEIKPQDMKNLRIPSGNEIGVNTQWIPGGYTVGGIPEAVMDFTDVPFTPIRF